MARRRDELKADAMNVFKKVKQQADHLFQKSDRTDVVGDDLRPNEERLDDLRILCEGFHRALEKGIHILHTSEEKKLRKIPDYQASEILKEAISSLPSAEQPDNQDLLRTVVGRVVELQQALGMSQVEYEEELEQQVLLPLSRLIKEDFPSVAKQKKLLKQVGLEVDGAKTRLRGAQSTPSPHTKVEAYREELEEAEMRLDQTRDSYACDVFSLLSRERQVAEYMCSSVALHRQYLQNALHKLELVLPDVQCQMDLCRLSPVFGVPLYEHLNVAHQDVAVVIGVCVRRLIEAGLYEEGLLRVAGSASKVRRLKAAFDAGLITSETLSEAADYDVHVVCGALKCYLRELPEPLLTNVLHSDWLDAVRQTDHQHRLRALWVVASRLPQTHLTNLAYLIKFLALVAANSAHNKMTAGNIATVIAPNLLWDQRDDDSAALDVASLGRSVSLAADYRAIVEIFVEYCDYFFKDNVDFGVVPPPPPSPTPPRTATVEANGALPITNPSSSSSSGSSSSGSSGSNSQIKSSQHSHRRNISADLTGKLGHFDVAANPPQTDPSDSPKQPQRTKKKQAPRPPQPRPLSTHGNTGDNSTHSYPSADSPEMSRSMHTTPPKESIPQPPQTPTPATRLHHTNSLRRPTSEPPKPPAKPPRPSPPNVETERWREEKSRAPVGFEQFRDVDFGSEDEGVLRSKQEKSGEGELRSQQFTEKSDDILRSKECLEKGAEIGFRSQQFTEKSDDILRSKECLQKSAEGEFRSQQLLEKSEDILRSKQCAEIGFRSQSTEKSDDILRSRPTDKNAEVGLRSKSTEKNAEAILRPKSAERIDEVVLRVKPSVDKSADSNVTGMNADTTTGSVRSTVQSFRQSLENVIQLQASGQPLTLPRHHATDGNTAGSTAGNTGRSAVIPPTPAQRTTIPAVPHAILAKSEKPALKEKPSLAPRPLDTPAPPTPALPRPVVPDRPVTVVGGGSLATPTGPRSAQSAFAPPTVDPGVTPKPSSSSGSSSSSSSSSSSHSKFSWPPQHTTTTTTDTTITPTTTDTTTATEPTTTTTTTSTTEADVGDVAADSTKL